MKKSDIFREITEAVCDYTELTVEEVLSDSRKEDVVIARCLIVEFGREYGHIRNKQLQELLHFKSHNSIKYMLDMYRDRHEHDRSFRYIADCVAHELDKVLIAITGQ